MTRLEFDLPVSVILAEHSIHPDGWEQYQFVHVEGRSITFLVPSSAGFAEAANMGEFLRIWAGD